jgi:hypothetical protein
VQIQFATNQLTALYTTGRANDCIPATMTDAFFEIMGILVAATEVRDVQALVLVQVAPQCNDCMLLHLQANRYLLARVSSDENDSCVEIIDVVEQP